MNINLQESEIQILFPFSIKKYDFIKTEITFGCRYIHSLLMNIYGNQNRSITLSDFDETDVF